MSVRGLTEIPAPVSDRDIERGWLVVDGLELSDSGCTIEVRYGAVECKLWNSPLVFRAVNFWKLAEDEPEAHTDGVPMTFVYLEGEFTVSRQD